MLIKIPSHDILQKLRSFYEEKKRLVCENELFVEKYEMVLEHYERVLEKYELALEKYEVEQKIAYLHAIFHKSTIYFNEKLVESKTVFLQNPTIKKVLFRITKYRKVSTMVVYIFNDYSNCAHLVWDLTKKSLHFQNRDIVRGPPFLSYSK